MAKIPKHLFYSQSSKQAFYFIEKIKLDEKSLSSKDWIVAFNNNVVIGARKWNGKFTDIPAMGYDGTSRTIGYCKEGDIPTFKLYIDKTGEYIELESSQIKKWEDYRRYRNSFYEFKPKYRGYDFIIPSKNIKKTISKMRFFLKKGI